MSLTELKKARLKLKILEIPGIDEFIADIIDEVLDTFKGKFFSTEDLMKEIENNYISYIRKNTPKDKRQGKLFD